MSKYIFDEHQQDQELVRLRMIEELFDPTTIEHPERTGIGAEWRCLELGAGAGSVMKWMGSVVGDKGSVVGVDKNTNHLQGLPELPFEIVEGDFLEIPLHDAFDLAHCRYVLIHNRSGDEMLGKLCNSLKPGGFLVVEEPDFTSAKLLNANGDDSQQRVNNAICRMFEEMELIPGYGLSVPEKIATEGLQIIEVDSLIHLARGRSPMARLMGTSTRALADKYVTTGEANEADIDRYIQNTNDDQFWTVYYSTISVIAKRH